MPDIQVDSLIFRFPNDWQVSKYDNWGFYRTGFSRMWDGIKSVDLLAVDSEKTAWLIEAKDYRQNSRTKPSDLSHEVAYKVFDTLAALLPAKINASEPSERSIAKTVLNAKKLRVVLQLEQPAKHSKLRPRAISPADIQQKLRQLLKPIDAHPSVVERGQMGTLAWQLV